MEGRLYKVAVCKNPFSSFILVCIWLQGHARILFLLLLVWCPWDKGQGESIIFLFWAINYLREEQCSKMRVTRSLWWLESYFDGENYSRKKNSIFFFFSEHGIRKPRAVVETKNLAGESYEWEQSTIELKYRCILWSWRFWIIFVLQLVGKDFELGLCLKQNCYLGKM